MWTFPRLANVFYFIKRSCKRDAFCDALDMMRFFRTDENSTCMLLLSYHLYLCKKTHVKNATILLLSMCYIITRGKKFDISISFIFYFWYPDHVNIKANKCHLNYQYVTQVNVTVFKLLKEEHIWIVFECQYQSPFRIIIFKSSCFKSSKWITSNVCAAMWIVVEPIEYFESSARNELTYG